MKTLLLLAATLASLSASAQEANGRILVTVGICDQLSPAGAYPCKTCVEGGGCPAGCSTSCEWFCCLNAGDRAGCRLRCSECNCPSGCANSAGHCWPITPFTSSCKRAPPTLTRLISHFQTDFLQPRFPSLLSP